MASARHTRQRELASAADDLKAEANKVIDVVERMRDFAMERNTELHREIKRDRDRYKNNWHVIEGRNEQINTCGNDRRRLDELLRRLSTPTAMMVIEIRREINELREKYIC